MSEAGLNSLIEMIWKAVLFREIDIDRLVILAARYILTEFDRDDIPDWIAVLAGGEIWDVDHNALLDEVKLAMQEE